MKPIVLATERDAIQWCREHSINPYDVTPVYWSADERKLRGGNPQVIQLERPHPHIAQQIALMKSQNSPERGLFIVFEGGEGAGKTTQAGHLVDHLYRLDVDITVSREPGGTLLGRGLRRLLLNEREDPPTARAEALMYAADRAHHVETVVRPSMARGAMVVCDRYVDSFAAYQGAGRKLDNADVQHLIRFATDGLTPDLTVLLDVPTEVGLARVLARRGANRLDREAIEFHQRVRQSLLDLAAADPGRYLVVPADAPTGEIASAVAYRVNCLLAERLPEPDDIPAGRSVAL